MMKLKNYIIAVLFATTTTALAQNSINVSNYQVVTTGDRTVITLDLILDSLRVPSNRYRAFTPIIRSKDGALQQRLKSLLVTGRTQDIVFEREGIDPLYANNYDKVRRKGAEPQTYHYTDAVAQQPWHKGGEVYVEYDLCGCGNQLKSDLVYLGALTAPDPYELISLTDVVPAPTVKERNLHGSAYITFVVNKWEMKPDYMNNRSELRKITDTLDVMVADPNVSVRQIKIHGWASPESPYEHNRMLATNRAKSLTDYVKGLYHLPDEVFAKAEATPENWVGLRAAVEEGDEQLLPHRQQILDIIDDNSLEPDPKEQKIKKLYPEEYRYLLQNVYPGLRRSDYDISFNFSDFTLEQAKEIYKTKPYQLSLREIWDVAQTYEPNSDEYNRVMQTAVNVYPEAPEAQLNLANVAIRQKDLLKAETLLERAGDSAEAINSRAVLAILQQRYDDAELLLNAAAQRGLDVTRNREAIQQLR